MNANYLMSFLHSLFKKRNYSVEQIISGFIRKHKTFNEKTPLFLLENEECIKSSIKNDINSIKYVNTISSDLMPFIKEEAAKQGYVLKEDSPIFLKSCKDVAIHSIKQDIKSAYYIDDSIISHKDIFKYLLLNGFYDNMRYNVNKKSFNMLLDREILEYFLSTFDLYNTTDKKYIQNFNKLYGDAINSKPYIKDFHNVFNYAAEVLWQKEKEENLEIHENIFGKICAQLRNNDEFNEANMPFLMNMKTILQDKYAILDKAMREYFDIYHSDINNKSEKFLKSQNTISHLSALYSSKCKENFKQEKMTMLNEFIKPYFKFKMDNLVLIKRLSIASKKQKLEELFFDDDPLIMKFLASFEKQYSNINPVLIQKMIEHFIVFNHNKLEDFLPKPSKYDDYIKYLEARKIINRLNSGYIKYEDFEVLSFQDVVFYDNGKYFYNGIEFDLESIKTFQEYESYKLIFEKIKKEIVMKIKSLEVDDIYDEKLIKKYLQELPFDDRYFEFDINALSSFTLEDFSDYCLPYDKTFNLDSLKDDVSFNNLYHLVIDNALFWILLLRKKNETINFAKCLIDKTTLFEIFDSMYKMTNLKESFNFDMTKFNEVVILKNLSLCADASSIAILGSDIIEKLYKSQEYTAVGEERIISIAKDLMCMMMTKNRKTVPFVKGEYSNYIFSIYNPHDEKILLSGIDTDACFRIDGNDNDFLQYCTLDKNGIVAKITDKEGNFIARASGFRNGNCLFFNQLRTIYDTGGYGDDEVLYSEKQDIINTFIELCENIVYTSQLNIIEPIKIDYVFVTASYSLSIYGSNISSDVEKKIGEFPMEHESDDWNYFRENALYLNGEEEIEGFDTDYPNYPIILVSGIKNENELKADDLHFGDVEALYARRRHKVMVQREVNDNVLKKINKIRGIEAYLNNKEFKKIEVPPKSLIIVGDNWYIVYHDKKIIDSLLLSSDKLSRREFLKTKEILEQGDSTSYEDLTTKITNQRPYKLLKRKISLK